MTIYTFHNLMIALTDERRIAAVAVHCHDGLQMDTPADMRQRTYVRKGRKLSPCGTRGAYLRGCRCEVCRLGENGRQREYARQRRERKPVTIETPSAKFPEPPTFEWRGKVRVA